MLGGIPYTPGQKDMSSSLSVSDEFCRIDGGGVIVLHVEYDPLALEPLDGHDDWEVKE